MPPAVKSVSLGELAATDLHIRGEVIARLEALPASSVDLIVSDHFDILSVEWSAFFGEAGRVLSVAGCLRLAFNTSALGADQETVEGGLARMMLAIAKAGLSCELLHGPSVGIMNIPFAEIGRIVHRSRKWQIGAHASQATVVMDVRPSRLEIRHGAEVATIKRRDFSALRPVATAILEARAEGADVTALLNTIAGIDGVFDDAMARAFVSRHAEKLLAAPESRELCLNLLQVILRGGPAVDITDSAGQILRQFSEEIAGSYRLNYLLIDLLKQPISAELADFWALVLYERPGGHRLFETVFSGYMVAELARAYPAADETGAPFDPQTDIHLKDLGRLGRFGNQITQFAYCLCAARTLGLNVRTPRWLGSYLFEGARGLETAVPPQMPQGTDHAVRRAVLASDPAAVAGTSATGFFNFAFSEVSGARDAFRAATVVDRRIAAEIRSADAAVFRAGRYIAVHIRRGDFGYGRFKITPEHIFEDMASQAGMDGLPVVLLTDAAPGELKLSQAFQQRLLPRGAYASDAMRMIADWYLLSQAPVLMHANSTFSFSAALHSNASQIFRPAEDYGRLVQYDPWSSLPFFG